jgi:hypothetical protein
MSGAVYPTQATPTIAASSSAIIRPLKRMYIAVPEAAPERD